MEFCDCISYKKEDFLKKVVEICDEVVELTEVKSWDEFLDEWSDIVFEFGRLTGWFFGIDYVSIWGDERHVEKIKARMREYGCVRSKRHLVCGKCCSL
jgi:hypothetical protein